MNNRHHFLFLVTVVVFVLQLTAHGQAHQSALDRTTRYVVPELVSRLPDELPKRVSGLAYDGEKLWVMIYLGRGSHATFSPAATEWQVVDTGKQVLPIKEVAGDFQSPGGVCFVGDKMWVSGAYGGSFGSIDTHEWKVDRLFKGKLREDPGSQSYSSMAYDGSHLWIAWHWMNYKLPSSETQLLLKIDPVTGKLVDKLAAPAGSAPDMTHGLTWDGTRLWHIKDNRLSAIDPSTGAVSSQYSVSRVERPSGLAWDGQALWIVEFNGNLWRLRI